MSESSKKKSSVSTVPVIFECLVMSHCGKELALLSLNYSRNQKLHNNYMLGFLGSPSQFDYAGDGCKSPSWRGCELHIDIV